jgi:Pilus assembly protein, PilP
MHAALEFIWRFRWTPVLLAWMVCSGTGLGDQYSLDTLKMVGTLRLGGQIYGLMETKDGLVHRLAIDNHIGQAQDPSWVGQPADWVLQSAVHLDSQADLKQLRATNPDHYARAVRLLAAGARLCSPGEPKPQNTDARDISCGMLLLTSNPPKCRLSFTLDHTRYVAIVTTGAAPSQDYVPRIPPVAGR